MRKRITTWTPMQPLRTYTWAERSFLRSAEAPYAEHAGHSRSRKMELKERERVWREGMLAKGLKKHL